MDCHAFAFSLVCWTVLGCASPSRFPILVTQEAFHAYHDQKRPTFRHEMESDDEILISAAFIKISEFLEDAKLVSFSNRSQARDIYAKWFYTKRKSDPGFPHIAELAKTVPLSEMVQWNLLEFKEQTKKVLLVWQRDRDK